MINRNKNNKIVIGKPKMLTKLKYVESPKYKYRIIIQQKPVQGNGEEAMRSITIDVFVKKLVIDRLKRFLEKSLKEFK